MAWYDDVYKSSFSNAVSRYSANSTGIDTSAAQNMRGLFGKGSGGSRRTQFEPRGFPEAINAEQLVPENIGRESEEAGLGAMFGALDVGLRSPVMVGERPIAGIDQILESANMLKPGESILDPVAEGLRSLPFVGGHLDNAGKLAENFFTETPKIGRGISNTMIARAWEWQEGKPGDMVMPAEISPYDWWAGRTVDDFREEMRARGWGEKQLVQMQSGEKGWTDFGDYEDPDNPQVTSDDLMDQVHLMAMDPLNAVLGVGVVTKPIQGAMAGARAIKAGAGVKNAATIAMRSAGATKHIYQGGKIVPVTQQVARLSAGSTAGISMDGLAAFGKKALKGYAVAAIGTTAAQVGVNVIDEVVPENWDQREGWIGNAFDFFDKMGQRKPLSQNDLLVFTSLLTVPGRTIASTVADKTAGRFMRSRRMPMHREAFIEMLEPELAKAGKYNEGWAEIVRKTGSEDMAFAAMYQAQKAALHEKHFLMGLSTLPKYLSARSLAEIGYHSNKLQRMMTRVLQRSIKEGTLSANDIKRGVRRMSESRGGVLDDLSGGVEAQFDPEDWYRTWNDWVPLAEQFSTTFKGGQSLTPGLLTDMVLTDDLMWAIDELTFYAKNGKVAAKDVLEVTRSIPAIYQFDEAQQLQRLLTRDAKDLSLELDEVVEALSLIRDNRAVSRTDFFASAEQAESLGRAFTHDATAMNNRISAGGGLADDISPAAGKAEVSFEYDNLNAVKGTLESIEGRFISVVDALRGHPDVIQAVNAIPRGLTAAGMKVVSAVDNAFLYRTQGRMAASPGLIMRMDEMRPMRDLMEAAAHALMNSGGNRATVVVRGDHLINMKGLVKNGTEYVYNVGRLTKDEWDDLAEFLRSFGDRVNVNTTEGIVKVILPDAGDANVAKKLNSAAKRMGNPQTESVHFRDVIKGKKNSNARSYQYALDDVIAEAKRGKRFRGVQEHIQHGYSGNPAAKGPVSAQYEKALTAARGAASADNPGRPIGEPTWYERRSGSGVRGGEGEQLVPDLHTNPRVAARWTRRVNEAGITPGRFFFDEGDKLYVTRNGNGGVVIRADGEFIPWRTSRNRRAPDDWSELLANAAADPSARWTRVIEPDSREAAAIINELGDHGFFPVSRATPPSGTDDIIFLLRDPDGVVAHKYTHGQYMTEIHGKGLLMSTRHPQQALAQVRALADNMYGEVAQRSKQAAKDAEILAKETRLAELNDEIREMQGRLTRPQSSSRYREAVKARDELEARLSTRAAQARRSQIIAETVPQGRLRFVQGAESDTSRFRVNLDESIQGQVDKLPPGEAEKIYALEQEMRQAGGWVDANGNLRNSSQYTAKPLPRGAVPYFHGQHEAFKAIYQNHMILRDGWRTRALSNFGQGVEFLTAPRFAKEMGNAQRQEMYNELINAGATSKEVNRFLKALADYWDNHWSIGGAKPFRAPDKLPPNIINKLAKGEMKGLTWHGFRPEVLENIGSVSAAVQRSNSRLFQNLAKKYPARDGHGNLENLINAWYGKGTVTSKGRSVAGALRGASWAGSVGYTVLRFLTDPRWYAMNALEADILGMARWGKRVRGVFGGKARNGSIREHMAGKAPRYPDDPRVEAIAGRRGDNSMLSVEETLKLDRGAAGWMDPRNLYGYVAEAMEASSDMLSRNFLKRMIDDGSPVIDDLKRQFGDDVDAWIDEIDDLLFNIDSKGAKNAIMDSPFTKEMLGEGNAAYDEFIEGLWKLHQDNYRDIVHVFHGNVNRNNLERLLNSPLLWWPLSYQLKVGKWMIDVATKNAGGLPGELTGSAALFYVLQRHQAQYENSQEYRDIFDDHPALWRSLGMFLPMTPFDMGVFMARWTRYGGSWVGAQLGVWDQDESYPQDPRSFIERSLALGPIYSWDIVGDVIREVTE